MQQITIFRPPVPRHVGLPRLALPELRQCVRCGNLCVAARPCPCLDVLRPCGADDLDPVDLDECAAGD